MDQAENSTKNRKLANAARQRVLDGYLRSGDPQEAKKFKDPLAPKKKQPDLTEDIEMVIGGD